MMGGVFPIPARRFLAEFLHNTTYPSPVYLAWGTGTNDITPYDTKLYHEMERAEATIERINNWLIVLCDFTITATTAGTAAEAGFFDSSSGGIMYWRGGFGRGSPSVSSSGYYQGTARPIAVGDVLRITMDFWLEQL